VEGSSVAIMLANEYMTLGVCLCAKLILNDETVDEKSHDCVLKVSRSPKNLGCFLCSVFCALH